MKDTLRSLLSMGTTQLGATKKREHYYEFKLKPQVKERGRAGIKKSKDTGRISTFIHTPENTRRYEERIGMISRIQHEGQAPLNGPLIANINFYFEKDPDGDIDNYIKAILDGMQQGRVFTNDKQIRGINAHVIYFHELDPEDERIEKTEVILSPRTIVQDIVATTIATAITVKRNIFNRGK